MTPEKSDIQDYAQVIWKRKWLIVIPTVLCMMATAAASFLLPQKWEIDCIITPGKLLTQSAAGRIEEFQVADPKQIAELINQETYAAAIADQLQIERGRFPKLEAKNLKNTDLILISLKTGDIDKGKSILSHTFTLLRKELDKHANAEIKNVEIQIANLETQIGRQEIDIQNKLNDIAQKKIDMRRNQINIRLKESQQQEKRQQIQSLANHAKLSQERVEDIQAEMSEVKQRVQQIENQQKNVTATDNANALSLLLYSNEIQQNLRYRSDLDREANQEKIKQEELRLSSLNAEEALKVLDAEKEIIRTMNESLNIETRTIENSIERSRNEIRETQNNIALLKEGKAKIKFTQFTKEPTASLYPVSPNKRLNVLIAAVLSLALFTLAAFFLEYVIPGPPKKPSES